METPKRWTSQTPALAMGIAMAMAMSPVHAAEDGGSTRVDEEVQVVGSAQDEPFEPVRAAKTPTPLIDVPQSISVVPEAQIREQAFTNFGDILRYTPGVAVSQGEGNRDAIVIRGNASTSDFFIDGIRDDVQYFRPLYNVQQVEILRGANALLFGRGGAGGVINRVLKRADLGDRFASLNAGVDSFGSYSVAVDGNHVINDRAAVRLNAFYEDLDNHRDFYNGRRFAFNPTATLKLAPMTTLFLSYEYLNDDRVTDRGIPSVTVAGGPDRPLAGARDTFFGSPSANVTTLEAHIVRARLEHSFNDSLSGDLNFLYADYDKLYQNLYAAGFDATTNQVTLDGYTDPTTRENLIVQGNLIGEFATGAIGHTVLFGGEYGNQDTTNMRADTLFPSSGTDTVTIPFTDPLNIPAFSFPNLVRDRSSEVSFLSLYLQDEMDLTDWLKFVGGFRVDRFDIDVTDRIAIANGNRGNLSSTNTKVSKRFGLIVKPVERLSLYTSYSESFLPRSGDQFLTLNNTTEGLDPQEVENIEFGAKWDVTPRLGLTAAVFRLEQTGVITADPGNPGNTIILPGTITRGFETQLVGDLTSRWSVSGGYSYLDSEVDGGALDGNETGQTPRHMFSLWNRYQATDKLGVALGVIHKGKMFVLQDNAVEIPSYTRVDAGLFYTVSANTDVQLNVENLFDNNYFPDAHNNDNISTGEPVNVRFTVNTRF